MDGLFRYNQISMVENNDKKNHFHHVLGNLLLQSHALWTKKHEQHRNE